LSIYLIEIINSNLCAISYTFIQLFKTLGNQYERCGNTDTIVVLREDKNIYPSRYVETNEQDKPYPNFVYHSCIDLSSANESAIYQFNLTRMSDVHPRHCVELCTNYKQQYSLLNSNRCLCTNIPMKKLNDNLFAPFSTSSSSSDNCTQECQANYFYTCGNTNNAKIYSVYVVKLQCPPGKRRKYQNYLITFF
jgi:hypothetical protein